ncbi:MAG: hypothetical protein LBM19_02755 [Holosporales bacterium]|jgi:hypothetical protein|nr:hypothetical protein [Holosporales bacterium]
MSFYSVGKNEICSLLEKEEKIKRQLKKIENSRQREISSFKAIKLKNEMLKIQNELKVLSFGNDDDGIA